MTVLPAHSVFRDYELTPAKNDIGILLEIASHPVSAVKAAASAFISGPKGHRKKEMDFGWWGRRDALELVSDIICKVPHYATPGYGPLMWPMTISKGKIKFVADWPGSRTGVWLNPFSSTFEPDLKRYGKRDLSKFRSQKLTDKERFELWSRMNKEYLLKDRATQ
jgi:hypothetical protein